MKKTPKYNVVVSDDAWDMLGLHTHFLARVSPDAARRLSEAIDKAICSLDAMPGRYPLFER